MYVILMNQQDSKVVDRPRLKQETLTIAEGVVNFTIPIDWNAADRGDWVYITKLDDVGSFNYVNFSVSDRPVTYADINWSQLDVYLTSTDFFTKQFIQTIKHPKSDVQVKEISNTYFTIFAEKELLPAGAQSQKDQPGGTTYYLKPKIANPTWNIIVRKQALGDAAFEADALAIMKSFSFSPRP
jgi:hypothetical protein